MYQNGDKVKLKNGTIVTISGIVYSLNFGEGYETYENILVTPDMKQYQIG